MRFAFIGTGFVADYYMKTLVNHPALSVAGVYDINGPRLAQFSKHYGCNAYASQQALLEDETVQAVAVLTDPESHFDIASAALAAGKHVYCEKPMTLKFDHARRLVAQADAAGLVLASAPANLYSDAIDLVRNSIQEDAIGKPILVYAEMEDGAVFRENWSAWRSESGAAWPGVEEFKVGCTLEHAGYSLSWLVGLFGPIKTITGTSAALFLDKHDEIGADQVGPDFSTAVLTFESGVVARLTCGLCAPKDRTMTVMGSKGTLHVADVWDNRSDVLVQSEMHHRSFMARLVRRIEAARGKYSYFNRAGGQKLRYANAVASRILPNYPSQIDFAAGLLAVADCAAGQGRKREILAAEALHFTEACLALNNLGPGGTIYEMTSSL